jgi:hypothetical protein
MIQIHFERGITYENDVKQTIVMLMFDIKMTCLSRRSFNSRS